MNYPLLDIFLTTMWIFVWILWFFLLFRIIGDLFRNKSTSGWAKALWTVFLIVVPFVGVFVYLIVHGKGMSDREAAAAQEREEQFQAYVRQTAADAPDKSATHVDDLAKLADLREHGDISEEEYTRAKEKVLA